MTCASQVGRGDSGSLRQKAEKDTRRIFCKAFVEMIDVKFKEQVEELLPLTVHSVHIFQEHHDDIWNKKEIISFQTYELDPVVCSWSRSYSCGSLFL